MRLSLIGFFSIILLYSCTYHDYYTVSSPDGSKCVTFEYTTSMIPNDSQFVKLYLDAPPVNKKHYVKMLWSNIGAGDIDWKSTPIKIRCWLLKENTIPSNLTDVKAAMSPIEKQEFHEEGSSWVSYDFTLISSGKYKNCEPKQLEQKR